MVKLPPKSIQKPDVKLPKRAFKILTWYRELSGLQKAKFVELAAKGVGGSSPASPDSYLQELLSGGERAKEMTQLVNDLRMTLDVVRGRSKKLASQVKKLEDERNRRTAKRPRGKVNTERDAEIFRLTEAGYTPAEIEELIHMEPPMDPRYPGWRFTQKKTPLTAKTIARYGRRQKSEQARR